MICRQQAQNRAIDPDAGLCEPVGPRSLCGQRPKSVTTRSIQDLTGVPTQAYAMMKPDIQRRPHASARAMCWSAGHTAASHGARSSGKRCACRRTEHHAKSRLMELFDTRSDAKPGIRLPTLGSNYLVHCDKSCFDLKDHTIRLKPFGINSALAVI